MDIAEAITLLRKTIAEERSFEDAFEETGYDYGEDALETFRAGWLLFSQSIDDRVVEALDAIETELADRAEAILTAQGLEESLKKLMLRNRELTSLVSELRSANAELKKAMEERLSEHQEASIETSALAQACPVCHAPPGLHCPDVGTPEQPSVHEARLGLEG